MLCTPWLNSSRASRPRERVAPVWEYSFQLRAEIPDLITPLHLDRVLKVHFELLYLTQQTTK